MATQNSNNVVTRILESKVLPRQWFPLDKAIDRTYVIQIVGLIGENSIGLSEKELGTIAGRIEKDRVSAKSWGKQKVEAKVTNNARRLGLDVSNFAALQKVWKKDGSLEMAAVLWMACYGEFDKEPKWELDLEHDYMSLNGLTYSTNSKVKGCFARMWVHCKVELIKSLNRIGKSTHGGSIRMKRTSEEVKDGTKFKKRKKGTCLAPFYNKQNDGHEVIEIDMDTMQNKLEEVVKKSNVSSPEKDKAVSTSRDPVDDEDVPDSKPAAKRTLAEKDDDSISSAETTSPMQESQDEVEYGKCAECGTIGMRYTECRRCEDSGFLYSEKLQLKDRLAILHQSKKVARITVRRPPDDHDVNLPKGTKDWKRKFDKLMEEHKKTQCVLARRQQQGKEKVAAAKSKRNKEKIANYQNAKMQSNNKKKMALGSKAKKQKAKKPTPVDSEDTESDEDVPVARVVADPDDGLDDTIPVVEAMEADDEAPDKVVEILAHKREKQQGWMVEVRDGHGARYWARIGLVMCDAPALVESYAKLKGLKGKIWKKPTQPGNQIIQILDHEGDSNAMRLLICWDNGFVEWADKGPVSIDEEAMVAEYLSSVTE